MRRALSFLLLTALGVSSLPVSVVGQEEPMPSPILVNSQTSHEHEPEDVSIEPNPSEEFSSESFEPETLQEYEEVLPEPIEYALAEDDEPEIAWGCWIEYTQVHPEGVGVCGYGSYQEACFFVGGIEQCESFFEPLPGEGSINLRSELSKDGEALTLSASWNGRSFEDRSQIEVHVSQPATISWSYETHASEPFMPLTDVPIDFDAAFASADLTFQVYKGDIGSSSLLYTQAISSDARPDITFTPDGAGHYIFVVAATFAPGIFPPSLTPDETCTPSGELCQIYASRLDDFEWFMRSGAALYNDVDEPIDEELFVMEDGEEVRRTSRMRPLALGMLEVDIAATASGVSNVLFLPGIKGSRLYIDENNEERLLWEPNGDDDVPELFLTQDGKSLRKDIYVKKNGIIDQVLGTKIYGSLTQMFERMSYDGTINDWESVAYDWRLSLPDLVTHGAEHSGKIYYDEASSTPYIEQTLRRLATSSQTGKVTLIAHSNGGLVAKALLQKIGSVETAALVDKIIFVGVPQSGAPQALGALLYGDREQLPNQRWLPPFILTQDTARAFAETSPMGYHLLPSQAYFDAVREDSDHPVAKFTNGYEKERAIYGNALGTFEELSRYLLAQDGGRTKPSFFDLSVPNVLWPELVSYTKNIHESLDVWTPPASVELYQIAGWGEDTISGIEFYEECGHSGCKEKYRPMFTEDGDGVVPVPSALLTHTENTKDYWLNLRAFRFGPFGRDHGNLFEISQLRNFLEHILIGDGQITDFISEIQPETISEDKSLRFFLHSPLTIEVEDTDGNRQGFEKDEIPGATYGEFGEVKYVTVPAEGDYTLSMRGIDFGNFSLDIEEVEGDTVLRTSTIAGVPVAPLTKATMVLDDEDYSGSSLEVDSNGDGSKDFSISMKDDETVFYVPTSTEPNIQLHETPRNSNKKRGVDIVQSKSDASVSWNTEINIAISPIPKVVTKVLPNTPYTSQLPSNSPREVPQAAAVHAATEDTFEWLRGFLYNLYMYIFGLLGINT